MAAREPDVSMPPQRALWIDVLLIAVPAFQVPLVVVAKNGIGIGHPERLLFIGGAIWVLGALVLVVLRRLGVGGPVSVFGVWLCTYLFMNTGAIPDRLGYPFGLILTVAVVAILLILVSRRPELRLRLLLGLASVLLLAEVVIAGYATLSGLGESRLAPPPGPMDIEFEMKPDVVMIIADAYVGVDGLSRYFDVDSHVKDTYSRNGFWVPDLAFSPYASTDTALATILDMSYPLAAGPGINRATRRDLYERIGGDNRVVDVFRQNEYEITMIESGWSGSTCGDAIDTCPTSFLDESVFVVLAGTWAGDVVLDTFGYAFTAGARSSMSWLGDNLDELTSNGKPDFVMAHLEIPHPPMFLDSECELNVAPDRSGVTIRRRDVPIEYRKALYLEQAACVDRFVVSLADRLPSDVLLIMAGDHGSDSHHQLAIHPDEWSQDAIRERLNAMFAFRGPEVCRPPEPILIADLFRHVFGCLSGEALPVPPPQMHIYSVLEFDGAPSPIVEVNASVMAELLGVD